MSSRETHKQSTRSYSENKETISGKYYATTNYEFQNRNHKRVSSTTTTPKSTKTTTASYKIDQTKPPDYLDSFEKNIFSLFESFFNEDIIDNSTTTTDEDLTNDTTNSTDHISVTTTIVPSTIEAQLESNSTESENQRLFTEDDLDSTTTETISTITNFPLNASHPLTRKSVITSTDCINGNETTLELPESNEIELTTILPELRTSDEGILITTIIENVPSTNEPITTTQIPKTATLRNIPDFKTILNITKQKVADYEYDYNEPSLPPSLPNLK